jgi:hypothetical protein
LQLQQNQIHQRDATMLATQTNIINVAIKMWKNQVLSKSIMLRSAKGSLAFDSTTIISAHATYEGI